MNVPISNTSQKRQYFQVNGVDYYLDPGFAGYVDTVNQQVVGLHSIETGGNGGTSANSLAAMLASLQMGLTVGSKNIATSQVTIGSDQPYLIAASRPSRIAITIMNTSSIDIYVGSENVSPSTGLTLIGIAGNEISIPTQDDIYAISSSGNVTVGILETF